MLGLEIVGFAIIGKEDFLGVETLVWVFPASGIKDVDADSDAVGSGVAIVDIVGVFDAGFNSAYATPLAITKPIPSNAICDFIISVWLRFLN